MKCMVKIQCHAKLSRSGATCLRTDIDDSESEGRPSTAINSEIAARVNDSILANRRVAVDEIANKLDISHEVCVRLLSSILISVSLCLTQQLESNILVIGRWTEILRRGHRNTYTTPRQVFK
ncbi:hypothetical protein AVEN_263726-1 [Araneus ventricosus]|uniref:Uncharacterized protein n=1 Tax=Araneus ventricosus TaxID=182803 RepID=A0A4Y2AS06_ARAVE|nr:hypothetical protein AVEN_263726-1 [Araneus ventricosus]